MEAQTINHSPIQQSSTFDLEPSAILSAKSREKLEELSKWRMDSSAIQFAKDTADLHGGFAAVCRASVTDTQDDGSGCDPQDVAIKKLNINSFEEREKVLGLALREARFLVELSHKNIVRPRGFVEDIASGRVWLVFPWAANGNLRGFIALAEWEVPERIQLIYDVVSGLEYLHTHDPPIYHGDLKSVNILVNSDRQAVLTDFGSARRIKPKEAESDEPSTSDTRESELEMVINATVDELANTMTLAGNQFTLRWAAPELLLNDEAGTEADMWSFGWVCYEVMTGLIPFSDTAKSTAVTIRIFKGDLPSLDDHVRMSLIRSLSSTMISCWSAAPGKRPTAAGCRKSFDWLPKCAPRPPQTLGSGIPEATLPLWLGHMYRLQSNWGKAFDAFSDALNAATKAQDSERQADALMGLAEIQRFRAEYTEAAPLYEKCIPIREKTGDQDGKADALFGLAEIHRLRGEHTEAVLLYERCLRIREETGNRDRKAEALCGLAEIHRLQDEYTEAVPLYEECIRYREETGDRGGKADAMIGLAEIHRLRDEYTEAVLLLEECLRIREESGDRDGKAEALWGLAEIHRLREEFPKAVSLFNESLQIGQESGNKAMIADSIIGLAAIHAARDEHNDAIKMYESAADLFHELGFTDDAEEASNKATAIRKQVSNDSDS